MLVNKLVFSFAKRAKGKRKHGNTLELFLLRVRTLHLKSKDLKGIGVQGEIKRFEQRFSSQKISAFLQKGLSTDSLAKCNLQSSNAPKQNLPQFQRLPFLSKIRLARRNRSRKGNKSGEEKVREENQEYHTNIHKANLPLRRR